MRRRGCLSRMESWSQMPYAYDQFRSEVLRPKSRVQKWIGLAHVTPRPKNDMLGDTLGGYVHVVALATDVAEFSEKLSGMLDTCDFDVVEIEDIEPLSRRVQKYP